MQSDRAAREIRRLRELVRVLSIVNATLCVLLLVAIFMLFSGRGRRTVTAIEVDGKPVVYVRNTAEAERLLEDVRNSAKSGKKEEGYFDPKQTIEVKSVPGQGVTLSDRAEARTKLLEVVRILNKGYAITVDGDPVVVMATKELADGVLAQVKTKYKDTGTGEIVRQDFKETVQTREVDAPASQIMSDIAGAAEKLTKTRGKVTLYTVVPGDTPEKIARKNGIKTKELFSLNPGLSARQRAIHAGEKLKVSLPRAGVTVITVREIQRKAEVDPGPPEETKTPNAPAGRRIVTREAKKGEESQTVRVTYENDRKLPKEEVVKRTVTKPAVSAVVLVGSGPP